MNDTIDGMTIFNCGSKFKNATRADNVKHYEVWPYNPPGKICWAKHSQFQPIEVFRGNSFAVHWPPVFITYL